MPPSGKEPLVDHGCPKVGKKEKNLNEQQTYLLQETKALIEYVGQKLATEGQEGHKACPILSDNALDFLRTMKSFLKSSKEDRQGGNTTFDTTDNKLDKM
ncbi:hypothetical protein B7463_g6206, partial [Scytalidium lignicola]